MNLGSLRDRARSLSGIRLQALRSDEQIDGILNESYQEVVALSSWPFLRGSIEVPVAAGAETFSTPSGFSEMQSVSFKDGIGTNIRLSQTTLDELDRLDQDQIGEPFHYARVTDRELRLWPAPETPLTLSVRGKLTVEPLANESDEPIFDVQFHPMIAYRTASKLLSEEGDDSGRSDMYQNEASLLYARMQQFYNRTSDVGIFVMGGRRRRDVRGY